MSTIAPAIRWRRTVSEDDLDAAVRLGGADALVLTGKSYQQTHDADRRGAQGRRPGADPGRRRRYASTISREVSAVADGVDRQFLAEGTRTRPSGGSTPGKVRAFMAAALNARPAA